MCLSSTGLVPLQCEICNCSNRELAIIQSPARYILGISNWSASGSDFVDFREVRIRSGGIFSSCFKVKAVSSFLPLFFIHTLHSLTHTIQSSSVAFYTTVVIGFTNPITAVYGEHNLSTDFSFSSLFYFPSSTSQSLRLLDEGHK